MKYALAIPFILSWVTIGHAQSITQVYGFACQNGACPRGARPSSIIQASDGNLYGLTASSGSGSHGTNIGAWYNGGTIFEISPSTGQLTVLYTFVRNPQTGWYDNGTQPKSLVEAPDGLLYGLAAGGTNSASSGLIFRISRAGAGFQVLQRFCTSCTNGSAPNNLVVGTDGNLYGTTGNGGFFPSGGIPCQGLGCGVVFRLTTSGVYTVLHALNGSSESSQPLGVIQASDGNLYGTATGNLGLGTIFRFDLSNGQFTTLYSFPGYTFPITRVSQASNGLLYGATRTWSSGNLTVFSSSLSGTEQNFQPITCGATKLNYALVDELLQASDGNLWGVCSVYGASVFGEVFSMSPDGTLQTTLPFNGTDGAYPVVGVIQARDGTLYGVTFDRGIDSQNNEAWGNVYAIKGLPLTR